MSSLSITAKITLSVICIAIGAIAFGIISEKVGRGMTWISLCELVALGWIWTRRSPDSEK